MTDLTDIYLAAPHGFCAGVKRAIAVVETTLAQFGAPVYVRHEIVHNKHVVQSLQERGVVFIEDWTDVADSSRPVIISAHGAAAAVYDQAAALGLRLVDATCPLVARVHQQFRKLAAAGTNIIVIGKPEHPEIVGTVGQADVAPYAIIHSVAEAESLPIVQGVAYGVVTQTTLAVDEVAAIVAVLQKRCGTLQTLDKTDVCYATTHRQNAVKAAVKSAPALIVIGSKNSSNSRQLQQVGLANGAAQAWLIDDVSELDWLALQNVSRLAVTAGASAPDHLMDELLCALTRRYPNVKIHDVIVAEEMIEFKSPLGEPPCPAQKTSFKS